MPILLALAAASLWGTSNFMGGAASRKVSPLIVTLWTTLANLALVGVTAIVLHRFIFQDVLWGVGAGVVAVGGMLSMYDAMARGRMSVVTPTIAVVASSVVFTTGLTIDGDRPAPLAYVGVFAAVVAVVLLTRKVDNHDTIPPEHAVSQADERRALIEAIVAGVLFGMMLSLISRVSGDSGVWVLVGERTAMMLVLITLVVIRRSAAPPPKDVGAPPPKDVVAVRPSEEMRTITTSGLIQGAGDVAFQYAIYSGALSLVTVVAALNPAMTVLLARTVLHERLQPVQLVGVVLALFAVAAISAG